MGSQCTTVSNCRRRIRIGTVPDMARQLLSKICRPRPVVQRRESVMARPFAEMSIDAEIRVPPATAQIVRFDMFGPAAGVLPHKIGRASCRERVCQYV